MAIETAAALLERELELAALDDAPTEARGGRGRVVLVERPAGIGKTSLLRAASRAAEEAGCICLRARASELEHDFAYGCTRQLLEPPPPASRGEVLRELGAAELRVASPGAVAHLAARPSCSRNRDCGPGRLACWRMR